jgi:hypothetical protein
MNFFTEAYKKASSFWNWYLVVLNIAILFYSITGLVKFSIMMVTISIPVLYYLRKDRSYPFLNLYIIVVSFLTLETISLVSFGYAKWSLFAVIIPLLLLIFHNIYLYVKNSKYHSYREDDALLSAMFTLVVLFISFVISFLINFFYSSDLEKSFERKTEKIYYYSYDDDIDSDIFTIHKGDSKDGNGNLYSFYRLKNEDYEIVDITINKVKKDESLDDKAYEVCDEKVISKTYFFSFNFIAWLLSDEDITSTSNKAEDVVERSCTLYVPQNTKIEYLK